MTAPQPAGPARFVVTGGAGFVGSHLVDRLVTRGSVLVLDDLSTGAPGKLAEPLSTGRARIAVGDICDTAWVRAELERVAPDATLFHLATRNLRRGLADPGECHRVNATGTLGLVEEWARRGRDAGRFVHVSTSEVFGTLDGPMDEDTPPAPLSVYGSSKLAGEQYVAQARRAGDIRAVILRPFNAYGPRAHVAGDSGELIPRLLARTARGEPIPVFGDGGQTRTFTYVTETAEGIDRAAEHPGAGEGVLLIASREERSIAEVAQAVQGVVGREVAIDHLPDRPADLRRQCARPDRTDALLGWAPTIAFDDGLRRTWDAIRETRHETPAVDDVNWGDAPPAAEPPGAPAR